MHAHPCQPVGSAFSLSVSDSSHLQPGLAWTPRGTFPLAKCSRGSAGGTRGFREDASCWQGIARLLLRAPPPRPPRTCCVLKSQPRQQRRHVRSATVLGVPAARLCVRASMCPAAAILSPRSVAQRLRARLSPRPAGLWTGVTRRDCPLAPPAGRSRVGLRLTGARSGPYLNAGPHSAAQWLPSSFTPPIPTSTPT